MNTNFVLYERFASIEFGDLPEWELGRICDVPPFVAQVCWRAWVSQQYDHLAKIPAPAYPQPFARCILDWDDNEAGRRRLQSLLRDRIRMDETIVHLWSPLCGVVSSLEVFLRRWTDFWYPSDDNCALILLSHAVRIEHVEEHVAIYQLPRLGRRRRSSRVAHDERLQARTADATGR